VALFISRLGDTLWIYFPDRAHHMFWYWGPDRTRSRIAVKALAAGGVDDRGRAPQRKRRKWTKPMNEVKNARWTPAGSSRRVRSHLAGGPTGCTLNSLAIGRGSRSGRHS